MGDESELREDLADHTVKNQTGNAAWVLPNEPLNWDTFERSCLQQALKKHDNNRTLAAKQLGMSYKTFVYRLNKFTIG